MHAFWDSCNSKPRGSKVTFEPPTERELAGNHRHAMYLRWQKVLAAEVAEATAEASPSATHEARNKPENKPELQVMMEQERAAGMLPRSLEGVARGAQPDHPPSAPEAGIIQLAPPGGGAQQLWLLNPVLREVLVGTYDDGCTLSRLRQNHVVLSLVVDHLRAWWCAQLDRTAVAVSIAGRIDFPSPQGIKCNMMPFVMGVRCLGVGSRPPFGRAAASECAVLWWWRRRGGGSVGVRRRARRHRILHFLLFFLIRGLITVRCPPPPLHPKIPETIPRPWRHYHALVAMCPLARDQWGKIGYLTIDESVIEADGQSQRRRGLHTETPGGRHRMFAVRFGA